MESRNELKENSFSELSERDKAFAVEYLTNGFKHRDAAEAVGLSANSGTTLLRRTGPFVEHLQSTSRNAALITKDFVEARYLELLPMLMGEEEVPLVDAKTGHEFSAKKFHSAESVSVLRDLAKSSGYIAPELGGGGPTVNVQINIGDLAGDDDFRVKTETIEHDDG